uniref:BTB domain-containing protein n=1 Tax=Clastoptera arizonana TaxID=38151 RepID=A0A1B6C3K6_9HEMI
MTAINNNGYDCKKITIPAAELLCKLTGKNKMRIPHPEGLFGSMEKNHQYLEDEGEMIPTKNGKESIKPNVMTLQPEMSLHKMGYGRDNSIDWTKVELPVKNNLLELIHERITNYINPDVFINIGNHEYRCHLLVLQSYSGLFNEKPVSKMEIPETSVTKDAFMYIYDWMLHLNQDSYTILNRENILEIFLAAQFLKITELEEQCWAFIDNEDLFFEDKAFMLYLDARKHCNTTVMELMIPRIQRFFLTLVSSKDFLELTVSEACVFLRSNYIYVNGEIEVFMSGVRWLMHDWEKRKKYLVEVMLCVRFGLIAPWQLVDIRRNPESEEFILVTNSPEVSNMIEDGLAFAIIKYWYGQESSEYSHSIDILGLTQPQPRNWVGSEKNYTCYREFLEALESLKKAHFLEKQTPESSDNEDSDCVPATTTLYSHKKTQPIT